MSHARRCGRLASPDRGDVPTRGCTRRSGRVVGRYGPLFRVVPKLGYLFNSLDVDIRSLLSVTPHRHATARPLAWLTSIEILHQSGDDVF